MSIDRTLKSREALTRHRNVLTRAERIKILADEGQWEEEKGEIFGLPKVAHRKSGVAKKAKKEKETSDAATEVSGEQAETPES